MNKIVTGHRRKLRIFTSALAFSLPVTGVWWPSSADAGTCTINDAALMSGQTATCSGDFLEENYTINPGVTNATIINNGNWVETGNLETNLSASILGPRNANVNYTGLRIVNNGSLSWTGATATNIAGLGNRTMSVMGSYFMNLSTGSTYINNGSIIGISGASQMSTFTGMGNVGRSGNLYSENTGSIYIDSSQNTNVNSAGIGMSAFGGSRVDLINSGDITVRGGPLFAEGMDYTYISAGFPAYVTGVINLSNSGNIDVSSTSGDADGMGLWIADNVATPTLTSVTMLNSGVMNVSSASGNAYGIYILNNISGVPVEIINQGQILSSGYSIFTDVTTTSPVHVTNTGSMVGDVVTRSGADIYRQVGGQLTGGISLGDGSDTAFFSNANLSQITVLDGGDDVSSADGMIDTLTFSGIVATMTGANVVNWENVIIDGGTLSFSDNALTTGSDAGTGLTITGGGTLNGGTAFALTGNMDVASGGTFDATGGGGGLYSVSGNMINAGLIRSSDGVAGDRTVVNGLYTGAGGEVSLDTALGADASPTDMLVLNGGSAGASNLRVVNAGGSGALAANGIKVVDVTGASNGAFALRGNYLFNGSPAIVGGAYAYRLYKNGVATPTDGDWYLRSTLIPTDPVNPVDPGVPSGPLYQEGVPTFEVYPQVILGMNGLPTLQQRVGNRFWSGAGTGIASEGADAIGAPMLDETGAPYVEGRGIWGRIEMAHSSIDPTDTITGTDYNTNVYKLQVGIDKPLKESTNGTLVGGLTLQYTRADADVSSYFGDGSISADGFGLGGTLTWYGNGGFYLDGQAQIATYSSNLSSNGLGSLDDGADGTGYALSLEGGQRFDLNGGLSLTPQAQLVYSSVNLDNFNQMINGAVAAVILPSNTDSLRGRIGLSLDRETSWQADNGTLARSHLYGIANLYYEFLGDSSVDVSGVTFASGTEPFWGGLGIGGSYNWNDNKYSIYGEGSVDTSLADFGDSYAIKGTVGVRVKW